MLENHQTYILFLFYNIIIMADSISNSKMICIYIIGGLVNPNSMITVDGNAILKRWITLRGIHNYHPRHLIEALDFVMANRNRFPFSEIVDSKFSLDQMDEAFKKAADRTVLRAAIVP